MKARTVGKSTGRQILSRLTRRAKYQEGLIKALSNAQSQPLLSPTATSFASQNGMYGASASRPAKSAPASTSSQISTLTDLLSTGNKREAVEYASRQSLWPHALIIASSVGPDLWRDTVKQFAEAELTGEGMGGMKAAYLLFAGAGASAADHTQVDELFTAANITDDPAKDQWKEVIGSVVLNGQPADAAQLDELGVRLAKKGLNNAASVWYVVHFVRPSGRLSLQTATSCHPHLPSPTRHPMQSTSPCRFCRMRVTKMPSSLLKSPSTRGVCCLCQRARRCLLLGCQSCCRTSCNALGWQRKLERSTWRRGMFLFERKDRETSIYAGSTNRQILSSSRDRLKGYQERARSAIASSHSLTRRLAGTPYWLAVHRTGQKPFRTQGDC